MPRGDFFRRLDAFFICLDDTWTNSPLLDCFLEGLVFTGTTSMATPFASTGVVFRAFFLESMLRVSRVALAVFCADCF